MPYSDSPYKVMKTNAFWIDFSEDIQHYRLWQGRKERYLEICRVGPRIQKGEKWYIQSFSQDQNELRWLGGLAAMTYVSEKDLPKKVERRKPSYLSFL